MSANRVLVHSSVAAEFKERFVARVAALTAGDPASPSTVIGPLINGKQVANLEAKVDAALVAGANALLRSGTEGNVVGPVVLDGVAIDDHIAQDELFGPVVLMLEFDTDDEAVAMANQTNFGLSGAVHSRDLARAVAIARQIETGMVHVNDTTIADEPIVPFGGEKNSGIGRLNGQSSIDELTTQQWVSVNHGRRVYPF
jgi:aldehyde dehydrogenase (NAD+)